MSDRTVHTYTLKTDAQRAIRKLRRGNILGTTQFIGRGSTMITVFVPSTMTTDQTGIALARALGDAEYEPIVCTEADGTTHGVAGPTAPKGGIHRKIKDQTELAITYAEDGAFRSAANVLRQLAKALDQHAADTDLPLSSEVAWTNEGKQ